MEKITADHRSLIDLLDESAALNAEHDCLSYLGRTYSYDEIFSQSRRIANALVDAGVTKGQRAAIYSPNHPYVLSAAIGAIRAGVIWVPINARNSVAENVDILEQFGCDALFYHSEMGEALSAIKERIGTPAVTVCLDSGDEQHPALEDWCAGYGTEDCGVSIAPQDIMCIPLTGGTTGTPKAVALSHRNMNAALRSIQARAGDYRPINLAMAPLTHVGGRLALSYMHRGGTTVISHSTDPGEIIKQIEQYRITDIFLPPTAVYALLDHPALDEHDLSSLVSVGYGSAPMSLAKLKQALKRLGPVMAGGFGQTEAPTSISYLAPDEHMIDGKLAPDERLRSVGRETATSTVRIMDDDGNLLPTGELGEIVVKGDFVSEGYFENPEATAAIRRNGWHLTGDIGFIDADGYITIVDRKKDMIITGGFNVYSAEVERVVSAFPGVRDNIVIGVPDEKWGEKVVAVIQPDKGAQIDPGALIAFAKERLGGVKAPKAVEFIDELPRTANHKVDKKAVRATYWRDSDRAI